MRLIFGMAQVARAAVAADKARQIADEKAREAAEAAREAEAAVAAGEYLQRQVEQCRKRLAQQQADLAIRYIAQKCLFPARTTHTRNAHHGKTLTRFLRVGAKV